VTVEHAAGSAPALNCCMVVANHVSWLDIFVVHSLHPSHFVAKAEIRSWPLAGWLAEKAGTVFIAR
jgi:1-acyl-sn-glycerol-3-phosphate acyltransferase